MTITQEEADNLNKRQNSGRLHPYTCDRKSKNCEIYEDQSNYRKHGVLIATTECWICPCEEYRQEYD